MTIPPSEETPYCHCLLQQSKPLEESLYLMLTRYIHNPNKPMLTSSHSYIVMKQVGRYRCRQIPRLSLSDMVQTRLNLHSRRHIKSVIVDLGVQ